MTMAIRVLCLRVLALALIVLPTLAPSGLVARAANAPMLDWPITNGHHFTQADGFPPGTSPMGYSLVDDERAKLWSAFVALGGVDRLGYPASDRFEWGGFITQVTQKAVLQWRPESGSVDFVNVFDDLGAAGRNGWLSTVRSVPAPVSSNYDAGLSWSEIVKHRVDLLRPRPALLARYQTAPDALDLYGLPVSPIVDVGPMYIVRLQRAVFQEWKVKEPWANPGDVTIANGGDVAKEAALFPAKAVRPIAPYAATWPALATGYTISGVATWYGPGFAGKAMANGATYDPKDPTTTASNAYPLGSKLKVTATATGKSIDVVVRDTGGFAYPDVADLSPAAFTSLGRSLSTGVIAVVVVLEALPPPPTSKTQAPSRR
jgi:hypothetical protein